MTDESLKRVVTEWIAYVRATMEKGRSISESDVDQLEAAAVAWIRAQGAEPAQLDFTCKHPRTNHYGGESKCLDCGMTNPPSVSIGNYSAPEPAGAHLTIVPSACHHERQILVDDTLDEVECGDCHAKLNPMIVLRKFAHREDQPCWRD